MNTPARRKFIVLCSLAGVLTLTSALLLALAPPPLALDSSTSLFAVDSPSSLEVVFDTAVKPVAGTWQYIYVRHSATPTGNAMTLVRPGQGLGDHFVIGNGDGAIDGEIQIGQRWNHQQPAGAPPGVAAVDPSCVTVCVIGDFDRSLPTPTQMRRLAQLVSTLQGKLGIPAERVTFMTNQPNSPAAVGKYFPATAFRAQLIP